ncbi:MAG: SIS domain-containing protein, partial [Armatimonadota bacterium]
IRKRDIRFAVIAARGTSDHAGIYGKYLLEIKNGMPTALANCSAFTLYNADIHLENTLVIGVSQSGQALDVIEYLLQAKKRNALTVAITNEPDSNITEIADYVIFCNAKKEEAIAATKTYTSSLGVFYLISAILADNDKSIDMLVNCANEIKYALELDKIISEIVQKYKNMQSGAVISRGINYCTALEVSLKLAETSYIGMRGYSSADFLHGPIVSIHKDNPCLIIAPKGKAFDSIFETSQKLAEKKANTIIFSSEESILDIAKSKIKLNTMVSEELSPLVYVIAGQLFAYHLAIAKGNNPDKPEGLNKVTLTR